MSLSYKAIRLACRARALALTVCTTGSATLSATATGYARATGSFLDDGFAPGMELRAAGFGAPANNGLAVVTHVAATTLTVEAYDLSVSDGEWTRTARTLATEGADTGRTLTVGLPALRVWEGLRAEHVDGVPWLEEQLIGGPTTRPGLTGSGDIVAEPQYQLLLHNVADRGTAAIDAYIDALYAQFPPGQGMTLASGRTLRVRSTTGPFTNRLGRLHPGFLTTSVSFPLQLYTPVTIN